MVYWLKNPLDYLSDVSIKRFWRSVDIKGEMECWPWKGRLGGKHNEYPVFTAWSKDRIHSFRANRVMLTIAEGFVPSEQESCCLHKCHNKLCVNPQHLYWGTNSQNIRDKKRTRKDAALLRKIQYGVWGDE